MSDYECKVGPYPEEAGQTGNDACDGFSTLDLRDIIHRRVAIRQRVEKDDEDIKERAEKDAKVIEQALAKEESKKQSDSLKQVLNLKEKDAEKLFSIIRAIIKDVLIEERVATKITVFK